MLITTTVNTAFTFNARTPSVDSFELVYTNEATNEDTTVALVGAAYADGRISFTASLGLSENVFYLFRVNEDLGGSKRELCKQKVFVTDQDVDAYKITTGEFVDADNGDNTFVVYE